MVSKLHDEIFVNLLRDRVGTFTPPLLGNSEQDPGARDIDHHKPPAVAGEKQCLSLTPLCIRVP